MLSWKIRDKINAWVGRVPITHIFFSFDLVSVTSTSERFKLHNVSHFMFGGTTQSNFYFGECISKLSIPLEVK